MTGTQFVSEVLQIIIPVLGAIAVYYLKQWANAHQHAALANALEITAKVGVGILIREAGGIANLKTPEIKNAAMAKTVDWFQNRAPSVVAGLGLTPQDIADSIDGRLQAALSLNPSTIGAIAQDLTTTIAPAQNLTAVPQVVSVIKADPSIPGAHP